LKTNTDQLLKLKDNYIDQIQTKLVRIETKTDWSLLWFAGGLVLGIGATVGIYSLVK